MINDDDDDNDNVDYNDDYDDVDDDANKEDNDYKRHCTACREGSFSTESKRDSLSTREVGLWFKGVLFKYQIYRKYVSFKKYIKKSKYFLQRLQR